MAMVHTALASVLVLGIRTLIYDRNHWTCFESEITSRKCGHFCCVVDLEFFFFFKSVHFLYPCLI